MAIKVKKDIVNINDELNRELSLYGFQIELPEDKDDKKEDNNKKKDDKKEDNNKKKDDKKPIKKK